ncbi:MAG: hypothetical protein PHI64_00985 [Zoogloea sp.]|uniref:hypothetical protein n=1 Tax=Zoogloea sp. TaxID=49181 RepID=UPI0026101520|nr:hypothetical protein [Zoogloea sp.]MDD2987509.1 hypothetical protein [Zoogloea sp.]
MSMTALRRLVATSLAGLLIGPLASAAPLEAVYEGSLVPESFDAPFPVTVELRDLQGIIVGQVKVGGPYSGSAPIASGEFDSGRCTLRAPISPGTVLRLTGTCHPRLFEGRYTLSSNRKDGSSTGSFRLMRKADGGKRGDETARRGAVLPTTTLTECINANTRCLVGCPQGDYNAEFLCVNRCRQRHLACKGKTTLPPPAPNRSTAPDTTER